MGQWEVYRQRAKSGLQLTYSIICSQHYREIKAQKVRDLLLARPQSLTQLTIFLLTLENGTAHYKWNSTKSKDLGARQTYPYIQAASWPISVTFGSHLNIFS